MPEEDFLACDGNVEELVFERLSEVKLKEDGCYLVIPDTSRVSAIFCTHVTIFWPCPYLYA